MKKVSVKVFLTTILILLLASFIPSTIAHLFKDPIERDPETFGRWAYVAGFIMWASVLFVFNYVMNRIILRRVRKLNDATKEVIKGNYDVYIKDEHQDEISEVTNNFNRMVNELKSTEYLNKEFVRNFSHELKTPLSAIKGYTDLVKDMSLSETEQANYLDIISKETSRLSDLSKNMLLISLVDSHTIIPQKDQFNFAEQIRNVIQLTQLAWERKNLKLNLELSEISNSSNKELLYQVWTNLFSNAIQFTEEGNTINLSLTENESSIFFTISNPSFISDDDLKNVFELFFVSEKTRHKQSSGVGLTLTKKIIEKLQGEINVFKENDHIKFVVTLPKEKV